MTMTAFLIAAGLAAGPAHAFGSAGDVVGSWGAEKGCAQGAYSYVNQNGRFAQIVEDNGKTYVSEIKISVKGKLLSVIDEEKMFTYRIVGPDSMTFIGFTNLQSGLSSRPRPTAWHRCH